MQKHWLNLFLLICIPLVTWGTPYFDPAYKWNMEFPEGWHLSNSTTSHNLVLNSEDQQATLNIFTDYHETEIPLNEYQETRQNIYYDGWINRVGQFGSLYQNENANVEDSYISVFIKKKLRPDLSIQTYLVAEYYYIKNQRTYCISLYTRKDFFHKYKKSIKELIDSFWIGEGERSIAIKSFKQRQDWRMLFGNPQKSNFHDTQIDFAKKWKKSWSKSFPVPYPEPSSFQVLYSPERLYLRFNNNQLMFNTSDGDMLWYNNHVNAPIKSATSINHSIYTLLDPPAQLLQLSEANGEITKRTPLSRNPSLSNSIIQNNHLIYTSKKLHLYDLDTQQIKSVTFNHALNPNHDPLSYKEIVVLKNINQTLLGVDLGTLETEWQYPLKPSQAIALQPMIVSDNIILLTHKNNHFELNAIHTRTGNPSWKFPIGPITPLKIGHYMDIIFLVYVSPYTYTYHLKAIGNGFGEIFSIPFPRSKGELIDVIFTKKAIAFTFQKDKKSKITYIDPLTGETFEPYIEFLSDISGPFVAPFFLPNKTIIISHDNLKLHIDCFEKPTDPHPKETTDETSDT